MDDFLLPGSGLKGSLGLGTSSCSLTVEHTKVLREPVTLFKDMRLIGRLSLGDFGSSELTGEFDLRDILIVFESLIDSSKKNLRYFPWKLVFYQYKMSQGFENRSLTVFYVTLSSFRSICQISNSESECVECI